MAFFDRLSKPTQSFGGLFFGGTDAPATSSGDFTGTARETREMYDAIAARVAEARATAEANHEAFSIEHYRKACVAFGENTPEGQRMVAEGKWNPASYADLSGQDLHGIRLTNPKVIRPEHDLSPAIQADYDSFDRDGDGMINSPAVNQFYDRVTFNSTKFNSVNDGKKTDLRNAMVDPATSFNKEIAEIGGDGLTINNMCADEHFTFGAGNYTNIHMTNINGGEIIFGDNSRVAGLKIHGKSATVTMGNHASVSNIKPHEGFSMLNFSMGEGSLLHTADLTHATISQTSAFGAGATLQDVTLGSNVSGVNFNGVTFKTVTFNGSNLTDTSFAGATLNGVAFKGVDVTSLDFSGVKSFDGVTVNGKTIGSSIELENMKLAAGVSIPSWEKTRNTPAAASAPVVSPTISNTASLTTQLSTPNPNDTLAALGRAQEVTQVNRANNPDNPLAATVAAITAAGVSNGAEATPTSTGLTLQVAMLKRTVAPEDQANGANMSRPAIGSKASNA